MPSLHPPRFTRSAVAAILLLGGLLSLRSLAQENDSADQQLPGQTYTVAGTVVNAVTGDPIRRALVQVSNLPGNPLSTLTDSEGRFQFTHIPGTEVILSPRKPGFFNEQELHPEAGRPPTFLRVDGNSTSIVLKLYPEGTISGRVATTKGEPLEDTPVRVYQRSLVDGRKRWLERNQAMTEEDGQFHIANLLAGQYLLTAGPTFGVRGVRVRGSQTIRREQINLLFYPGVPDLEGATPVSVTTGQQVEADFALKPEPVFKMSGVIIGLSPGTAATPQVTTRSGEPLVAPVTFDPQTAKFTAEVPAGSYMLTVRAPDSAGNLQGADLPITVNSDVENVTIALGLPLQIPVHVQSRSTASTGSESTERAPVVLESFTSPPTIRSGGSIHVFRPPIVQVRIISSETGMHPAEFQADANANDGSFAIRNLVPGKYSVELQPNPPWYVQAASSGTTDLLREDLVVSPGRHPDPIEVTLRDDGAILSGTVRADGQPAGGSVLLIPEQGNPSLIRVNQAAPGGDFLFDRVPPGDYKVLAVDTLEDFEFRNSDALSSFLSKATRVTLQPSQQSSVGLDRITVGK
jgi:hypothetical protein